ncbi:Uncharacterized conserved protein [Plasmopara halstedii]|uniref:Uncharacterized conserved protein n=1 Tax=Plasmopara halstedii TaxID=4781 RepID=A0A0P1AG98_PLAHL|nr:Uncharacterized conserved protein [Plasmopara halstedii]CEG40071.1 Uncharacterized conserved protein [Plasmopara halstedii]|eukprot:XP_024576440.1 Uncharacterized conserved protein [Plasmopara halstedii]
MTSPTCLNAPWRRREVLSSKNPRPQNHSLRRSMDATSSYDTFCVNSKNMSDLHSSCRMVGLPTQVARKRLLQAIEHKIHEKESSSNGTTEFRDPFSILLALCAIFRFSDAVRNFAGLKWDRYRAGVGEGLFLVAAAAGNVLLNMTQKRRHHAEMAERVRVAVQEMLPKSKDKGDPDEVPIWLNSQIQPTVLLPSNSYAACYRDNQWVRLPMNLLVEGDVVGLMSGDIAPGDVQSVETNQNEQCHVYARGCKLPSWNSRHGKDTTRCTATFDPPLLLKLCGEMRIFEMLETPVLRDIEDALFRIRRPLTPTQKLQIQARQLAVYVCTLYSVLVLVAIALRALMQHRSIETLLTHILLGPIGIWLCFASLNTPLVLFVAEAAATASILGSFDNILEPTGIQMQDNDQNAASFEKECQEAKTQAEAVRKSNFDTRRDGEQISRTDSAMTSFLKATSIAAPDIYDVEDREKLRSEKAQKQSATRRSLQYFLVVLRFRVMYCKLAHLSDRRFLPVPLRSFRLLERLGSITMLCCFDDDILCEQTPSVEEIFLLNDKQGSNTTVLDLHAERSCDTGLQFEDPKWKHQLPSLKPIGFAIMVNDNENAVRHYEDSMQYLVNEALWSSEDDGAIDPYLRSCMQRLSAHIRMLPFPKHLLNLSREMGFSVAHDLTMFQRRQSIHIICPRLAHYEHSSDHHDQGQEDTRYRGNLKSHLYSTVVLDKRSHRHQLLSRGHPTVVLAHCSEYWDGKSICPLSHDKQRAILEMYNQWRVEDLDCIAFSYVPVPSKLNNLFRSCTSNGHGSNSYSSPDEMSDKSQQSKLDEPLPPVYLVDDSAAGELNSLQLDAARNRMPLSRNKGDGQGFEQECIRTSQLAGPNSPLVSPHSVHEMSLDRECSLEPRNTKSTGALPSGQLTPPTKRHGHFTMSDIESSMGLHPSETNSVQKDSMLWRMQDDQIFLGMVATGVQPKQYTPDFIEDLDACGIRFVYFSPRNMRRSKMLAEKMGIETDWNCAISLRPLISDGPDPHRMTSNYSDWDVKARLPHGVEAIKRHLAEVDNVPLLVSLYTDSTPDTISEMISIFQENHEVVMGVGSSVKESNAPLFSKADLAIALQGGVHAFFDKPIPHGKELSVLSDEDIQFSHILNTLACAFRLDSSSDGVSNQCSKSSDGNKNTVGGNASVAHLIELIRLGRRMLTNFYQLNTFIFVSQLFIATIILASYAIPFPHVPQLTCASIFWLLWAFVPALSLSMLASESEKGIMKKTPRKNEELDMEQDLSRLIAYFIGRHVPSVLLSLAVFECLFGFSLEASNFADPNTFEAKIFYEYRWLDFVLDTDLETMMPRSAAVKAAVDRAEAGMLLVIGICIVTSSCGYLYRCESIFKQSPLRNIIWVTTACALLCLQFIFSILRAGIIGADGVTLWHFVSQSVPQSLWALVFGVWPLVILSVDEAIKIHDRRHFVRYNKFLRMQFDTRLGMWSPK